MDVVLVYMGADDKGIVALRQFQGQLTADLVRLLWRDFAGAKGLAKVIGDHIVCAGGQPLLCSCYISGVCFWTALRPLHFQSAIG